MIPIWFLLSALSFAFVAVDVRRTPAHPVLKWAFVILAVFAGPFAAFFYVLGCREPLRGTHEAYVAARWRQVLGSTMHCAAGDGLGIIVGAAIAARMGLPSWTDLAVEYALGFGFGWAIFQALAMREMAGGSYSRSLRNTFFPEFVSMNLLMAGMVLTMRWMGPAIAGSHDPLRPGFWFVASIALIAGFVLAFPINWWLVANHLKHGMITVRPASDGHDGQAPVRLHNEGTNAHGRQHAQMSATVGARVSMGVLSVAALAIGIATSGQMH